MSSLQGMLRRSLTQCLVTHSADISRCGKSKHWEETPELAAGDATQIADTMLVTHNADISEDQEMQTQRRVEKLL